MITLGRVLVVAYVLLIGVIVFGIIPKGKDDVQYLAPRFLGKNTRLAAPLLIVPADVSMENRLVLARQRRKLEGRYLNQDIEAGKGISLNAVSEWPEINSGEVAPLELPSEPDWMLLNQGSRVEIWLDDNPEPEQAVVSAIVPAGSQWIALLRKKDLKLKNFGPPAVGKNVRIAVVAAKPGPDPPQPAASPTPAATPSRKHRQRKKVDESGKKESG